MTPDSLIRHEGEVISVSSDTVQVRIRSQPACSACRAAGRCFVPKMSRPVIVCRTGREQFREGEPVWVQMEEGMGKISTRYAFLYPLLLVMGSLIFCILMGMEEKYAGIISLLSLFPYYIALSFVQHKITREFGFSLARMERGGAS